MKWLVPFSTLGAVAVLSAGCHDQPSPTSLAEGEPAFAAKAGGKVSNPRTTFTYVDPVSSSGIFGDGRGADGLPASAPAGESVYDDGKCGVTSQIFANGSQDATMDPVGASISRKNCAGYAEGVRSLEVRFGTALAGQEITAPAGGGHYSNVRRVTEIGLGGSGERFFTLLLRGDHTCERIRYDAGASFGGYAGAYIKVTRTGENTWEAESQPAPDKLPDGTDNPHAGKHIAFCQVGGSGGDPDGGFYDQGTLLGAYDLPLKIRIVQK